MHACRVVPRVTQVATLCKISVCFFVFSGCSLGNPYSPLTSRQLTTGEQFQVREHHAEGAPEGLREVSKPASAQDQPAEVPNTPAPAPYLYHPCPQASDPGSRGSTDAPWCKAAPTGSPLGHAG